MVISIDINRKLDLEFSTAKVVTQTEQQRKFKELKEDCPSFDLGFDLKEAGKKDDEGATIEEPVIISSNDSGDSLDKIYATIDMPITPSTVQVNELQKTKLREPSCHLDKEVQKAFECKPTYRLDHKDMILFSVLQNLTPDLKIMSGHYYLIVLNLKAGRFEVMDSMRKEGDKLLMQDARNIIGSIKHFWQANYSASNIDISKYMTVHIPTPMQKTTYDCGYFVLKFIESWDGRRLLPFSPYDMPALRKLYLKRWMATERNLINWDELLFPN
nr:uncharacterized protein LOC127303968 [Lolium perenne]